MPASATPRRDRWQRLPLVFHIVASWVYRAGILLPARLILQLTWPKLMQWLIITLLPLIIGLIHITRVKELIITLRPLVKIQVDYLISDISRLLNDFLDSVFLAFNSIGIVFLLIPWLAQISILCLFGTCERHELLILQIYFWALELPLQSWT